MSRFRHLAGLPLKPRAFGHYLAEEMKRVDVSQRELAARAGVNHSTISRLLSGREPLLDTAIRLAKGLAWYDGGRRNPECSANRDVNNPTNTKHDVVDRGSGIRLIDREDHDA